jgi:HSP20 family protein
MIEARREIFHAVSWQVSFSGWNPPTDVFETEENFIVRVEIAGMKDADFEVAIEKHVLTISGNRSEPSERRAYRQMEIRFGKFEIAVEISVPVEIERSVAEYKDGFLVVQLPKLSPKHIEVE